MQARQDCSNRGNGPTPKQSRCTEIRGNGQLPLAVLSEPQHRYSVSHPTHQIKYPQEQDDAFKKAKHIISPAPVLQYYDLSKPGTLQDDTRGAGVGGALLKPNSDGRLQLVAYTSNSLNATEQRYSQIEKECLVICKAFKNFDHWLYGKSDIGFTGLSILARALAGDIVLCSWARHFTLTVPLSTRCINGYERI